MTEAPEKKVKLLPSKEEFAKEKGIDYAELSKPESQKDVENQKKLVIFLEEYSQKGRDIVNAAIEKGATDEDLKEIRTEIRKSNEENIERTMKLLDQVKELRLTQEKALSTSDLKKEIQNPSFKHALIGKLTEKQKNKEGVEYTLAEKLIQLKAGNGGTGFKMTLKAMTVAGNTTADVIPEMYEEGLNRIARRRPFIRDLIQNRTTTSPKIIWRVQVTPTGTTGGTAEGNPFNEIGFSIDTGSVEVKKRTNYIQVSDEMLQDVEFIADEIQTELLQLLNLDIDNQILQGDGLGDNLEGILTLATTYNAGSFAASVVAANEYDVINTAVDQVVIANHMVTDLVMYPSDVTKLGIDKASDGHYLRYPMLSPDGMSIMDISITANSGIPSRSFLVMDSEKSAVFTWQEIELLFGMNGNDFIEGFQTVRCSARVAHRIKQNDTTAFVTGDFDTAIAALLKP